MAAKYFVWGEGVWRELDVASGRVTGWRRRARFVFLRRGKLQLARQRPVLRALQALAAGQAGAAADGPRLSHLSKSVESKHRRQSPSAAPQPPPATAVPPACMHQHHCCAHTRCFDNDKQTPAPLTPAPVASLAPPAPAASTIPSPASLARRSISTQCGTGGFTINVPQKPHAPPVPPAAVPSTASSSSDEFVICGSSRASTGLDVLLNKHASLTKPTVATSKKHKSVKHKLGRDRVHSAKKRARVQSTDQTSSSVERAVCKELLVSEDDVAAMRAFVRARCPSALERFDNDDKYKRMLFYSINPLVDVERCAQLERMLTQREQAALPHFAARLGLTPRLAQPAPAPAPAPARARVRPGPARRRIERSTSSDTDKENKEKHSSPNKVRSEVVDVKKSPQVRPRPVTSETALARVGGLAVAERDNKQKQDVMVPAPLTNGDVSDPPKVKKRASPPPPASHTKATPVSDVSAAASSTLDSVNVPSGTHVISKRASQANAKEYSNLEDHAIVAWVSSGSRASLVSGNRVWRDLQEQYERLTGRTRSWHSLRNRYLRYILPSLGALHLPPATVSRLRAAAATGVIKTSQRAADTRDVRRHSMFKEPERGASSRVPRPVASSDGETQEPPDTADTEPDDDAGPSSPKRRSLRPRADAAYNDSLSDESRTAGGSQQAAHNKQAGSRQSASKTGGSQQSASKAGGSLQSASKVGGSQQSPRKVGGSQQSPKKTGDSQQSPKKAGGSQQSSKKAGGGKAALKKQGGGKEARRSPRYSDVTRRFAARHRLLAVSSSSSSSSPGSSRSASPVLQTASRSRRLFNPNAV